MQLTDFFQALPWLFIGLAVILRLKALKLSGVTSALIAILYSFKMLGTLALQWLYTYYYPHRDTADIFRFYDDGLILFEVAKGNIGHYTRIMCGLYDPVDGFKSIYFEQMNSWIKPFEGGLYNDNIIMIKLNSMLTIITQSGYEANSLLFSAFAFSGLVLIIKTVVDNPEWRSHALLIIGLLPSYLLFLSRGLKESVLLIGAGMPFLGYYNAFNSNNKWLGIVQLAIGCWLLIIIKPYFIASILPAILAYQITQRLKLQSYFSWGIWGVNYRNWSHFS